MTENLARYKIETGTTASCRELRTYDAGKPTRRRNRKNSKNIVEK